MPNIQCEEAYAQNVNSKLLPVSMSCEIEVELHGFMAITKINQTFTNTTDQVIEAVHSIPVPVESTLNSFQVKKNDQSWSGRVIEKSLADRKYEESLEAGNSAFQLKRSKEDLFTLFLGNLQSKETMNIEFELVFPIQFIAGQGQLYLPLVMGERYGKSNLLPEADPENSFLAEYPVNVTVKTNNLPQNIKLSSPSHPMSQTDKHHQYLAHGLMDRDLKILFDNLPELSPRYETMNIDEKQAVGLMTMVAPMQSKEDVAPRDILFILDCSGSMQGSPIQQLKESVYAMLGEMRSEDRFNLYPYGSTVEAMFDELQEVNETNLTRAKQMVRRNIDADLGGTETISAMLMALMSYQKTRPSDVVLITDGEIWLDNDDAEMQLLKAYAKQNNIRFFTVGVGHAATENTVKHLAEISGGSYILTNPYEDIRFQMQSHFQRLFQSEVSIELNTPTEWHKLTNFYQGDAIIIPVWVHEEKAPIDSELTFSLLLANEEQNYSLTPSQIDNPAILKWIADQRFRELPEHVQVEYAVKYQLLTSQTDYLIELERAEVEKSEDLPNLVKIPQMNVHGREYSSSDIMFSRKASFSVGSSPSSNLNESSNYLEIPAFLRRQADEPSSSSLDQYVNDKLSAYKLEKQRKSQEKNEIGFLTEYLESILESGVSPNYEKLGEYKCSQELVLIIRYAEINNTLYELIEKLLKKLHKCDSWQQLDNILQNF